MFLQLPTPTPGQLENWLIPAAAVASLAVLAKKLFLKKSARDEQFVTLTEFHHELGAVRDKIDARFASLSDKLELVGRCIQGKLTEIESAVARLDERTKK